MGWTCKELAGWIVGRPSLMVYGGELYLHALNIHNQVVCCFPDRSAWTVKGVEQRIGAFQTIYPPAVRAERSTVHVVVQPALRTGAMSLDDVQGNDDLGPQMIDAAALAVSLNLRYVVVRGTDNGLYVKRGDETTHGFSWSSYAEIPGGGRFSSAPDIAFRDAPCYLEVAARGMDNRVWHNQFNGSRWDGWSPVGLMQSPWGPGITALDEYTLFLCAAGPDLKPRMSLWKDGAWDGLLAIAGVPSMYSAPAVATLGPRSVAIAYVGPAGTVQLLRGTF